MKLLLLFLFMPALLGACGEIGENEPTLTATVLPATTGDGEIGQPRWYDQIQIEQGKKIFADNCATCHGEQAQGLTENWKQKLADGNFPPPPLNGTAHAWHHPLSQLLHIVDTGGSPYGGQMPPFAEVLKNDEKRAAIAFFQSFWTEETYLGWLDMGGLD